MRMILAVAALAAGCGGGFRSTRVLGEQEYVAFADRPSGGYAPMAPPDCDAGADECTGQYVADVQIGPRGGSIERVLQTRTGYVIYVRANPECTGDPAPNWKLLLRKPVQSVNIVHLGKPPVCGTATL
jgi:hypothetical protein